MNKGLEHKCYLCAQAVTSILFQSPTVTTTMWTGPETGFLRNPFELVKMELWGFQIYSYNPNKGNRFCNRLPQHQSEKGTCAGGPNISCVQVALLHDGMTFLISLHHRSVFIFAPFALCNSSLAGSIHNTNTPSHRGQRLKHCCTNSDKALHVSQCANLGKTYPALRPSFTWQKSLFHWLILPEPLCSPPISA